MEMLSTYKCKNLSLDMCMFGDKAIKIQEVIFQSAALMYWSFGSFCQKLLPFIGSQIGLNSKEPISWNFDDVNRWKPLRGIQYQIKLNLIKT